MATGQPDTRRLLHELQVHQIELEMQNEELQKARDEMEAGLEKYSDLYDFAPVGYLTLDREGAIAEANLAGASLLGIARAALVQQHFGAFVSPADRSAFAAFLQQAFKSKSREACDVRLLLKGTDPVDVRIRANVSRTGQACQLAVSDITESKRTEKDLLEKARLLDLTHDAIIVRDMEGHIRFWNHGAEELYGWSRKEALGKLSHILLHTEFPTPLEEMIEELHRTDRWIGELVHTKRDGRRITVLARKTLDRDRQGNPVAVLETITDITGRKHAEEILRRSEAIFSALIGQAPIGVYVVDARLRLQQVNPRALPVFSNVKPLIGRDLSEVIHVVWPKRVADQVMSRFRHTLKTGAPYQSPDFAERRRDTGVDEAYEWQIQRVTLPAGEYGVVCFFTNITERKRAEWVQRRLDALTSTNQKLEQENIRRQIVEKSLKKSERHQTRLLTESHALHDQLRRLSHQLLHAQEEERKRISRELHDVIAQNLVGINVHLAALSRENTGTPRPLQQKILRTQRLVEKAADTVHRFARELRPTALDDLGLIPALHSHLKDFMRRTGIRASLSAYAGVETLELASRTVLYRIAQEALANVARHAQASHAWVTIHKQKNVISLEIKDNGKGFETDRATNAKKSNRIGLLGMRERIEMIGGTFCVESTPGKPTAIRVEIPLKNRGPLKRAKRSGKATPLNAHETAEQLHISVNRVEKHIQGPMEQLEHPQYRQPHPLRHRDRYHREQRAGDDPLAGARRRTRCNRPECHGVNTPWHQPGSNPW